MKKDELVIRINDLLLKGYTKEEILEKYNIEISEKTITTRAGNKVTHKVATQNGYETYTHMLDSKSWQLNTILKTLNI